MKSFIKSHAFAFVVLLLIITGCSDSPFLTKEEAEKLLNEKIRERDPFHNIQHLVAIINNDIYYFDDLTSEPRRLTNTPSDKKTRVTLSHDHTRVAYLNKNSVPVIINTTDGGVVTTLTDYAYPQQMDWAQDRLSLYILYGQEVFVYGEPLTVTQPDTNHPWDEISSYSLHSNGDFAYFKHAYNGIGFRLFLHSPSNNIDEEVGNFEDGYFDYVDFYDDKGGILLGEYEYSDEDDITNIICTTNYDTWASYDWDPSYGEMISPKFNGDREVLVYGEKISAPYHIKFVYLGTEAYQSEGWSDILMKVLEDYPSNTPIYVDWVE